MTRGAGSYHFTLREKLKGFESIKSIQDKGLVYEYVTTLNVRKKAFAVGSIEAAKRFYNGTLGCPEVTFRSPYFLEIPLFGKLLVAVEIDGYRGPPPRRARTVVQAPCFGWRPLPRTSARLSCASKARVFPTSTWRRPTSSTA